ncbi:GATA zinc finger domain-containing protein 4-like [Aphidius gifuensis]|uniref:GATA zinc finger domain-containing protein 4-like n=1 Tax=Aphidius gifuensis TaxID=684658 RepID=UPI001CDCADFB|nr:GATA zinc finger domain-containing protein 4-like [Aphidius gifuensis]
MNDSFLEEIGLVDQPTGCVVRGAERHITTRRSNSPRSVIPAEQAEWDLFIKQQKPIEISTPKMPKSSRRSVEEINSQLKTPLLRNPSETINNNNNTNNNKKTTKDKSPGTKVKNSAKKNKSTDVKLKTVDNIDQQQIQLNNKNRLKISVSSSDNSRLSDNSTKENSRPFDGSADSINNSDKIKERKKNQNDNINKKFNSSDGAESFAMLNAIKEVVSSYTKIESNKIMKMMQDLHINSQSNMIKQMLSLSDDIKEQNLGINSGRFQSLVQENAKLLDNINYLKNRVDELQKSQEDYDKLRQENSMLKIRLCEYEKK